jgi:hypothetical protein
MLSWLRAEASVGLPADGLQSQLLMCLHNFVKQRNVRLYKIHFIIGCLVTCGQAGGLTGRG